MDVKDYLAQVYYSKNTGLDTFGDTIRSLGLNPVQLGENIQTVLIDTTQPKLFFVDFAYMQKWGKHLSAAILEEDRPDVITFLIASPEVIENSAEVDEDFYFDLLIEPVSLKKIRRTLKNAMIFYQLIEESQQTGRLLSDRTKELQELTKIGTALSTERDHDRLLSLILEKSREITGADGGTLYLVENSEMLRFKLSQNDSIHIPFTEFTMPINDKSISGYVALTGDSINIVDVYNPPQGSKFRHDPSAVDKPYGYRTKSMLTVAMKDHQDTIIGVIQLINKKPSRDIKLTLEMTEQIVIPFDQNDEMLISSLASQAAVSIENNQLYENIKNLFERFAEAAVKTVELRDPATSGHSSRVATLTVGLAKAVDRCNWPRFRNIKYGKEEITEIYYSALLHDMGKVVVPEAVLTKAKKLYPYDLQLVKERFEFIKRTIQLKYEQKKLEILLAAGRNTYFDQLANLEKALQRELAEADTELELVVASNEPTILEDGSFEKLLEIARKNYEDASGQLRTYLTEKEARTLRIRKGSLDDDEYRLIQSHVQHTMQFLDKIPWTRELGNVPKFAWGHHENLIGTGYPNKLTAADIPLPTRMMTIADIFDALAASDRPYKKAVPVKRALEILGFEVKDGKLDADLYQLFVEEKIYELTAKPEN